jgi:cell division protease FtsH
MTAYHEAGHAVVSLHYPASDPIHKATIIPRGRALGMVMRLPESDKLSYKREKMYADLAVAMGGRVAEELVFGSAKVSSGASSDIQYATKLSRAMVAEWGMSEKLGPVLYAQNDNGEPFLGQTIAMSRTTSEATAAAVDTEIKRIVLEAHTAATKILTEHRDQLEMVALALLEFETLTGDEIALLMKGEKIARPDHSVMEKKPIKSAIPSSRRKSGDETDGSGDTATTLH